MTTKEPLIIRLEDGRYLVEARVRPGRGGGDRYWCCRRPGAADGLLPLAFAYEVPRPTTN